MIVEFAINNIAFIEHILYETIILRAYGCALDDTLILS